MVAACFLGALLAPAVAAAGPTIVSLTFDDGTADQYATRAMLAQDSVHATFYINSNNIGSSPSFLTWDQVSGLAADGNEIAGHTLDHVDLTSVSTTEATRQVCDDRQALISHGFNVIDFAYPYGASNSTVESIVRGCGYSSARKAWGLCTIGLMPPNCNDVVAETIPPHNIWEIASAGVRAYHTLSDIEGAVTRAEAAGGGWVPLLFHHVCDACDPTGGYSVSPAVLSAFLDWLAPRSSSGTYVRTMSDVVTDTTPPASSIACNGTSCSSWYNQPVSVSLSATDAGTAVTAIRYTTDGSTPTTSSTLYTGPFSVSTTTTVKYRAWDMAGNIEATNSRLIQFESTVPVSAIACNSAACSSSTYTAPVSVSLSATDSGGSGVAAIRYSTDGSDPTTSSTLYTGPFSVLTTTTVKYRAWDTAGNVEATKSRLIQVDLTPPASAIACNGAACSSSAYTAPVSVSLSASDPDDAVAAIRYTIDGSDPTTSSTLYTGPFSVSTTTTVKYRAWDTAGNVEATKSQLIQVDLTPPVSAIACNGAACASSAYTAPVSVSLSASDPDDAVAAIRYTTDGSDPTTSSSLYTGPFSVSTTTTVKYRAWDTAGNVEATKSQLIQVNQPPVDTTAPTSTIACNGTTCSSAWYGATSVSVSLSATDPDDPVAAIRYTTDGSDPSASSTLYTGPFSISTTTTVKYRAWDTAGNVETTKSQLIQFDFTPPVSAIACNGAACSSSAYAAPVSVALSATDSGGSGVAAIRYTTDGSDPTVFSTLYSGPFSVSTTTTVKYRAWDNAGNIEATQSQLIQVNPPVDTTAPTSTIACNGAACSTGWYGPPVSVSLSATDPDDAVVAIRYTTDGSDPTTSSTLYTGPFPVPTSTTLKYRAWDTAGNVEATKSQLIQVDTFPPTVSITSPANGATVTGNVKIVAAPTDAQTGVASVSFYVDGSLVATSTSSPWQVPWNTKKVSPGQHVLTAVARDRAGNSRTSVAVTVTVR